MLASAALFAGCGEKRSEPPVLVGIGDQDAAMFADPFFRRLGIRRARIVVPWNVAVSGPDRDYLDNWLRAAHAARVEPLVHFAAATGSLCPADPCRLPSVRQYEAAFRAFRRRWPAERTLGVWNEANQRAQPTFRHPERVARYFNVVERLCRDCRVVAADVIDDPNMEPWVEEFKRYARRPSLWGLHNYRDTNRRPGQLYGGTKRLLSVTRGPVWLTETGGIVKFVLPNGHTLFPFSEARADRAVKRMFSLAARYRNRVRRLYVYHWRADPPQNRFDAGLLRFDGTPRPSYSTVANELKKPGFRP